MGESACELLDVELALDRVDAELARELPGHVRAFAHAYAAGHTPSPAPSVLRRASTLTTARRACAHPVLADRGRELLRLSLPIAIDDDAGVIAARAVPPSWAALAEVARARDVAVMARFGMRAIELVHRVQGSHGVIAATVLVPLPPRIAAWHAPTQGIERAAVRAVWDELARAHGAVGALAIETSAQARPRAFVVRPGAEVVVVIPGTLTTGAERFAALHELGHAVAALVSPIALPRVVDEAVAAYVARRLEQADALPIGWASPDALAARARRTQLAITLDAIERALPSLPSQPLAAAPPWALWHDPGAQAAYVAAERLADAWWRELGATPGPGALAVEIAHAAAAACGEGVI